MSNETHTFEGDVARATVTRKKKQKVQAKSKDFWDYFIMQAMVAVAILLIVFAVNVVVNGVEPLKEAFPVSLVSDLFGSERV